MKGDLLMEWNEEKEKELLISYKRRFSLRFTLKVVQVLVLLFVLYTLYMVALQAIYTYSKAGERLGFYQQLTLDWKYPQYIGLHVIQKQPEITPYLTQIVEVPVENTIGKEIAEVGNVTVKKSVLFPAVTADYSEVKESKQSYYFYLPTHPVSREVLSAVENPAVWEKLDMIHEGFVADLAFSTDDYYSPEEMNELLQPYDIDVLWMPLYMGESKMFDIDFTLHGENSLTFATEQWGLAGGRKVEKDGQYVIHHLHPNEYYGEDDISALEESQQLMLENMEMMLRNNKRLAEMLLQTSHLEERYNYVKENGFQVFGAVVTGPVKELLKLQEEKAIRGAQLGEVEIWNWSE